MKKLLSLASLIVFCAAGAAGAQTRKSVNTAEVNGTFRSFFSGKFKGSYSEVKILALGGGKLRVALELVYPYTTRAGEMSANLGTADGTATITGDTAVFSPDDYGQCVITIKFLRRGTIQVAQSGTDSACGFGHNVHADGTYKKTSDAKPKFER